MNHRVSIAAGLSVVLIACADRVTSPSTTLLTSREPVNAAPKNTPVKSDLLGGATGTNSIRSDGLGLYQNGVNGVVSILQSGFGDWELDMSATKSTRKARIDFSDPLPGNPGAPPFVSALVKARLIAKASQINASSFAQMTGLGSTLLSPLSVAFAYNGAQYAIRMNAGNHPASDWVRVTCTGVVDAGNPGTSACNKWNVAPTGVYDSIAKNVGYVERVGTPSTFIGMFYFSLDLVVSK
jgi:hypothetical protein